MNEISPEVLKTVQTKLDNRTETEADRRLLVDWIQNHLSSLETASHPDSTQALAQELQRRNAELDAFRRVSQHLTSHLDVKRILKGILSEAVQMVDGIEEAHIYLYDAGKLTFGAALWASGDEYQPVAEPRPQGLTYTVARLAKTVAIADMSSHTLFDGTGRTGSIIGIPLRIGARVVGVMTACRPSLGDFSAEDTQMLVLLADHAAIAIENARLHHQIEQQAQVDELTGLYTRRSLNERLEAEALRYQTAVASQGALGSQRSFSLLMMDLDGFKQINDAYGQHAGDYVLKEISHVVTQALRRSDFLARFGGDELALLLSDTDQQTARIIADRIQQFVSQVQINLPSVTGRSMSVSIGVALFPENASTVEGMIEAADQALYTAKSQGPGSVVLSEMKGAPLDPNAAPRV